MKICSVILSAGKGSRMKSDIPKPFHKIAGARMIDWVINANYSINPNKIVIVSSNKQDYEEYSNISKIIVQKKPCGTGDAIKHTKNLLENFKGIVIISYADTPFVNQSTLKKLISSIKNKNDIAVTGFKKETMNSYGKIILSNGKNPSKILEERKKNNKIKLCNGGIMAFNANILFGLIEKIKPNNQTNEFYLTEVVEIAANQDMKIDLINIDEQEIIGVNDRFDLLMAEKVAQDRLKTFLMNKGVTVLNPNTTYFSYDNIIEKDVIIHPNVVIGNNVKIKSNSEIFSFTHLEDCIIHKNSKIGPFARIRGGSKIGKNSKIGNFVELKNSKLENDVKINHLSYIGDTNIGSKTNIGAGTITCNYDGFKKNKTTIGYGTFVGSNSTLIAPIKIGHEATIAAGSVITENVPEKALSIARTRQITKKNRSLKIKN